MTDSKDSEVAGKEPVQVFTELSEAPKTVTGFSDNLTVDSVESGAKAGVVAEDVNYVFQADGTFSYSGTGSCPGDTGGAGENSGFGTWSLNG